MFRLRKTHHTCLPAAQRGRVTSRGTPRRYQAGQALVEMAVLTPLLLLLVIGIIELGRLAYYAIEVSNAARAGVQYGSQNLVTADDNAGMQLAGQQDAPDITGLAATATHYCACASGGGSTCLSTDCPSPDHRLVYVQVNTTGTLQTLFNYPGIGSSFTVSGHAVMRVAQ